MKIEWVWRYELMDDPVEGETVPVVRLEELRHWIQTFRVTPIDAYERAKNVRLDATLRELATLSDASLKETP